MKRLSSRKVIALLLGLFLVLGAPLSAVQAGEMADQMVSMDGTVIIGADDCDDCNKDGADLAGTCSPICPSASAAVLPSNNLMMIADKSEIRRPDFLVSHERVFTPDPHPPKPIHLG